MAGEILLIILLAIAAVAAMAWLVISLKREEREYKDDPGYRKFRRRE